MSISVQYIVGIDEAGRGPLAGPVAVGVVIAPVGFDIAYEFPGVADSKILSEKKRESIFKVLCERAGEISETIIGNDIRFFVSFSSASFIDSHGIVAAVQNALDDALRHVISSPHNARIFLDGSLHAPKEYVNQKTIIRGDVTVPIISLASIATKVSRDAYMVRMAKKFPMYGFEKHKGYGTKMHREALVAHGPSSIHRRTFLHNFLS